LIAAAGVCATTAILGYSLYQCVKVDKIEIWTPPASQGAAATCSVLFPGSSAPAQGMTREYTDTTVSTARPAHVVCRPPPKSLGGFWQDGVNGDTLFTLVAPSGSIIDIWMSMVLADGARPASASTAVLVGATIGNIYYCSLDSTTKAGSLYTAIGLASL
jgi:hypothetical protein